MQFSGNNASGSLRTIPNDAVGKGSQFHISANRRDFAGGILLGVEGHRAANRGIVHRIYGHIHGDQNLVRQSRP